MLQAAYNTIPSEHHEVTPWSKSVEPDGIHKTSPILGFAGYEKKSKKSKKK